MLVTPEQLLCHLQTLFATIFGQKCEERRMQQLSHSHTSQGVPDKRALVQSNHSFKRNDQKRHIEYP